MGILTSRFTKPVSWRLATLAAISSLAVPASAVPFSFSTGNPDGLIATGSRPSSAGKIEIESADDFILTTSTNINHATFTGLLPTGAIINNVRVEIYRVFPKDSTNPPSGNIPTRVNSPSDVAFAERDVASSTLSFTTTTLNANFAAANSVLSGVNKIPNQTTGGEGAVRGEEVLFDITFSSTFSLPADHYFFIPQVESSNGDFLWLSAPKPIVAPGTPFAPDLQSWVRNENLAPDWLRIGTDIVGAGAFNAAFSLSGETNTGTVPEPATLALLGAGMVLIARGRRRLLRLKK